MPSTYQSYTKIPLSGAATGLGILVASTGPSGTAGTTIHTAVAGSASVDEIVLYASSTSAFSYTPQLLTLQWGAVAVSGSVYPDEIRYDIPFTANGMTLIVSGLLLNGGLVLTAFSSTANAINLHGFVNRIALV